MTKYLINEHFTREDNKKLIKVKTHNVDTVSIDCVFYNSDTKEEERAGADIPVTLKSLDNDYSFEGVTNEGGYVNFSNVTVGDYLITATDPTNEHSDGVLKVQVSKDSTNQFRVRLCTNFLPNATITCIDSLYEIPVPNQKVILEDLTQEYSNVLFTDSEGIAHITNLAVGDYHILTEPQEDYEKYSGYQNFNPENKDITIILESRLLEHFDVFVNHNNTEKPVANALVEIMHKETEREYEVTTDENGLGVFQYLLKGEYTYTVTHPDYQVATDELIADVQTEPYGIGIVPTHQDVIFEFVDSDDLEYKIADADIIMTCDVEGVPNITGTTDDTGRLFIPKMFLGYYGVTCHHKYFKDSTHFVQTHYRGGEDNIITVGVERAVLNNVHFKLVNKFGEKRPLFDIEVGFYTNPEASEEEEPDIKTLTDENGISRDIDLKAGDYKVRFKDPNNVEDWISGLSYPKYPVCFDTYSFDKNTPMIMYELGATNLPELKIKVLSCADDVVKGYDFFLESEVPDVDVLKVTTDDDGFLSIRDKIVYDSKVRLYCYDKVKTATILFDETFVADKWDKDYVKTVKIGARTIPDYALKFKENLIGVEDGVCKLGTEIIIDSDKTGRIQGTTDEDGIVHFKNILTEEEPVTLLFESEYYSQFIDSNQNPHTSMELTPHYDNADVITNDKTFTFERQTINCYIQVRKTGTTTGIPNATVKISNTDRSTSKYFVETTNENGIAYIQDIPTSDYGIMMSCDGYVTESDSLMLKGSDDEAVFDYELQEQSANLAIVCVDPNGDALADGTTVTISKDGVNMTKSTSGGIVHFDNITTGTYKVVCTPPETSYFSPTTDFIYVSEGYNRKYVTCFITGALIKLDIHSSSDWNTRVTIENIHGEELVREEFFVYSGGTISKLYKIPAGWVDINIECEASPGEWGEVFYKQYTFQEGGSAYEEIWL